MKSKNLFFILIFLLPLNLGKHFVFSYGYVSGLLVDYLIPVIYVQDLLILLILVFWVFESRLQLFHQINTLFSKRAFSAFPLFIACLFFSTLTSGHFQPSLLSFLRILLYFLLFLYVATHVDPKKDFRRLCFTLFLSAILVSLLAIFQYVKQGSVFNNYLILGEQPYAFSTRGVIHENFFGFTKVPAYGLFRHPNILGGFLSVVIIWALVLFHDKKRYFIGIFICLIALLMTFSFFAVVSLLIGTLGLLFYTKHKNLFFLSMLILVLFSLFLPSFKAIPAFTDSTSFIRRSLLLEASFKVAQKNILFGVGLNNFYYHLETTFSFWEVDRFLQPVHNIFMLIFSESGIISLGLFFVLLVNSLRKSQGNLLLTLALFQLVFLGLFDHYIWTIHQTQLLFWLTLGLIWTSVSES